MTNYVEQFHIRYIILSFTVQFLQDCTMPSEKVSAIRGGLGNRLLHENCINKEKIHQCKECMFQQICIVQRIMYAPLKIQLPFIKTGESEGYIISCKNKNIKFNKEETLSFSITLFGDVIIYMMSIVQALYKLGYYGLGKEKAKFKIIKIEDSFHRDISINDQIFFNNCPFKFLDEYIMERMKSLLLKENDSCKVILHSPLCLKYQGDILEEFHVGAFFNGLSRRSYIMNCFEGRKNVYWRKWKDGTYWGSFSKGQKDRKECEELEIEYLPEISVQKRYNQKVKRYSTTHQKKIIFYGIGGEFSLFKLTEEMIWYLLAGEILHIGKHTSFGFGEYEIEKI